MSTLSGPGTSSRIRPVVRDDRRRADHGVPFPVAFRPPALASRVIRCPPGDWAFLTVGLPGTSPCPDPSGLPRSTCCEIRPGWVPPVSRGRRCSPGRQISPRPPLPLPSGQPLYPRRHIPSPRASITRHQRSSRVHPSGLPLACCPRMERKPFGFPLGFEPRCYQRRTSGWGRIHEH